MTLEELNAVLCDWFADYTGTCSCSQVYGRAKYEEARQQIGSMGKDERRKFLSKFMRKWLEDERLAQGYGWEDAKEAAEFIEDELGVG